MFGVFYLLGKLIASTIADVKDQYEDYECRQKYVVDKEGLTYIDPKGAHRFRSNGHPVWTEFDKEKETMRYVDMKTHKVISEFYPTETARIIEEQRKRCKEKGRTVIGEKDEYLRECNRFQSVVRDVDTREKYVIRRIRDRYYYVNKSTGYVVRETDLSKKTIKDGDGIHPDEMNKRINVKSVKTEGFPEAILDDGCKWKI